MCVSLCSNPNLTRLGDTFVYRRLQQVQVQRLTSQVYLFTPQLPDRMTSSTEVLSYFVYERALPVDF